VQSLAALKMTRVMVAHRPQTIAIADRVVLIENGRLVETPRIPCTIRIAAPTDSVGVRAADSPVSL
jgi:ATP-binding cassette subfamily B protein RaxB